VSRQLQFSSTTRRDGAAGDGPRSRLPQPEPAQLEPRPLDEPTLGLQPARRETMSAVGHHDARQGESVNRARRYGVDDMSMRTRSEGYKRVLFPIIPATARNFDGIAEPPPQIGPCRMPGGSARSVLDARLA
jgi:hypothetical protein